MGVLYSGGFGVPRKHSTAQEFYELAAKAGHIRAVFNLGQMRIHGIGIPRSCFLGIQYLKTVAESGAWAGDFEVAYKSYTNSNFERAAMLYSRLSEEGHEVAQLNAAWLLDNAQHDITVNYQRTLRHYMQSSEQGNVESLRMIGDYNYYGKLANKKPNYVLAAKYYTKASNSQPKPDAQSMFNLGFMHEHGVGIQQDFHLAKRFYDDALITDPDAFIPMQLVLLELWIRVNFLTVWELYNKLISSPTLQKTENEPTIKIETSDTDVVSFMDWSLWDWLPWRNLHEAQQLFSWVDMGLIMCCGALAVVAYMRALQ